MRTFIALASAGLIIVSAVRADEPPKPGEKDSFDSLLTAMVKTLNDVGDTLAKISDYKAAKEATPQLEKLAQAMAELGERGQKLGKPTGDEEKALEAKFKNDLTAASKKLTTEIERLKGQPYGKSVLDALKPKPKAAEKPKAPADKPKDK